MDISGNLSQWTMANLPSQMIQDIVLRSTRGNAVCCENNSRVILIQWKSEPLNIHKHLKIKAYE